MEQERTPRDETDTVRTVDDLLAAGRERLRASTLAADFAPSRREATLLLAETLAVPESTIRAFGERTVAPPDAARYLDLVARRAAGWPVAYLLGRREFFGRTFRVDPRVLIPRPETEHLVEAALELRAAGSIPDSARVLDIGTGSGCLAVTLALELRTTVTATDLSLGALDVARRNAARLGARVDLVRCDLASALRLDTFDLVVSNPPYVARDAAAGLSPEVVEHEPHLALFAPERGTLVLEALLGAALTLRHGAWMLLEMGFDQKTWLEDAVAARPGLELVRVLDDLAGYPRGGVVRRWDERR